MSARSRRNRTAPTTSSLLDQALALLRVALPLARVPGLRAPLRGVLALIADVRA